MIATECWLQNKTLGIDVPQMGTVHSSILLTTSYLLYSVACEYADMLDLFCRCPQFREFHKLGVVGLYHNWIDGEL